MHENIKKNLVTVFRKVLAVYAFFLIIGIVVAISYGAYIALNDAGLISHTKSVDMYMTGGWIAGESRNCIGFQSQPTTNHPEITSIDCPIESYTEQPHNVEVKFFGKVSRPDIFKSETKNFEWRCKREESGFTCFAMN